MSYENTLKEIQRELDDRTTKRASVREAQEIDILRAEDQREKARCLDETDRANLEVARYVYNHNQEIALLQGFVEDLVHTLDM